MHAAVVTSFETAPVYREHPTPEPGPDEIVVDVVAAGLHRRVRSQADGSHYTSTEELPLVPGVDGVGRDADGNLRYFVLPDTTLGSMAEQTLVDPRRSVVLPDGTDAVAVAAAMNPAMSSWVALRQRITFEPGQDVLVLGATGASGRLAVQIARRFGAGRVIAAGRNPERLAELTGLGATDTVSLAGSPADVEQRIGAVAADVDVVIDYVWGEPTVAAMTGIVTRRTDQGKPLTWIEIGSMSGPTATIPSAALRAARLSIVGSGQGSVPPRQILAELPELADAISAGAFAIDTLPTPLADVERAWRQDTTARVVFQP